MRYIFIIKFNSQSKTLIAMMTRSANIMKTTARLDALRAEMKLHAIDAYYIPGEDAHQVSLNHFIVERIYCPL